MLRSIIFTVAFSLLLFARCFELPQDPDNPGNSSISLELQSSSGLSNETFIVDSVDHQIQVLAIYRCLKYVKYTTLQVLSAENAIDFDTTLHSISTAFFDTISVSVRLKTPGEKLVVATIHIENGEVRSDTAKMTILGSETRNGPQFIIEGQNILKNTRACTLYININNPQDYAMYTKYNGISTPLIDNKYIYTPVSGFTGYDSVLFIVTEKNNQERTRSEKVLLIVVDGKLQAPQHLYLTRSVTDSIILHWEKVNNALMYAVYKSSVKDKRFTILQDSITSTEYWARNVAESYFYVIAKNKTDISDPSNLVSSKDTGNSAPQWDAPDTFHIIVNAGKSVSLNLKDTCFDANNDPLEFKLLQGGPAGDAILNGSYTFSSVENDTGNFLVRIVAFDLENLSDTLFLNLSITPLASTVDTTAPSLKISGYSKDSIVVDASSKKITFLVSDQSGIKDLGITIDGTTIDPVKVNDSTFTITVQDLKPGKTGKLIITVTDKSPKPQTTTKTLFVTYVPVSTDRTPPNIKLITPPKDSSVISSSTYTIQFACSDSSRIGDIACNVGQRTFTVSRAADTLFSVIIDKLVSNQYIAVTIKAVDSSANNNRDSLVFYLKYDSTLQDDVAPAVRLVEPLVSGSRIQAEPAVIKIVCKDDNGIKNVSYMFKGATKEITSSDSVYSATVSGLTAGGSDTIRFKITDKSSNTNSKEFPVVVKYNRTVGPVTLVSPANNEVGVTRTPLFTWSGGDDPDNDSVFYKVQFGLSQDNLSTQFFELKEKKFAILPEDILSSATNYHWQVIAYTRVYNDTSRSAVGQFTTIGTAPLIASHPTSQSAKAGQSITFTVTASGTDIRYQWQRAGVDIPGATTATYVVTPIVLGDNGVEIRCKVYNTVDTASSRAGIISVLSNITYDGNGAQSGAAPADTAGYTAGAIINIKGGNTLARTGNVFAGWSRMADGSGKVYNANDTLKISLGGVTLYARWTVQTYRVSFEANGGSAVTAQDVAYNGFATVPAAPTKNGYSFGGWYISNTLTTEFDFASTPIVAARVVYAKWNRETYTITYVLNGGTLPTANPTSYNVESPITTLNNPVKIDSTFTGWYTTSSLTGTAVTQIPIGSYGNKTLYAGWVWANTVTDIDGNVYPTVKIGNQIWTSVNLRVTKFNDGTAIKHVPDSVEWFSSGVGAAYCFYANTTNIEEQKKYGALYNRIAVIESKIAPPGWHVPTYDDWLKLKEYLYKDTTSENNTAKAIASKTDWNSSDSIGVPGNLSSTNNRTGFNALPAGRRWNSYKKFEYIGNMSFWWLPETGAPIGCVYIAISNYSIYIGESSSMTRVYSTDGFSVRLIKD
jgi:uncharacterized protein (TIGR02145 family)/uncharacterized repeat protein (TIGR02543 family)